MINRPSSTSTPLGAIFESEINELRWIAEVILGDAQSTESCIAKARSRAGDSPYVAPDWRKLWIKRCVAREAIDRRRAEIARFRASGQGSAMHCAVARDKAVLRCVRPARFCEVLNTFERAALILHAYLGFSVQDCALLLDCHWSSIEPASSAATCRLLGSGLHAAQEPEAARPLGVVA